MTDNEYIGPKHGYGPGMHISFGAKSFLLRDGQGREWRTEWHSYFGPSVVNKNGDPAKRQPGERSPFWRIAQWWHDQGAVVVDGVGVWKEVAK